MSEQSLWGYLSGGILPPEGQYTRVESNCSPGFPDVDYTLRGVSGTIELKFSDRPKAHFPFKRRGFRDTQVLWTKANVRAGGYPLLIAQCGRRYLLLPATQGEFLESSTLPEIEQMALYRWNQGVQDREHLTAVLRGFLLGAVTDLT